MGSKRAYTYRAGRVPALLVLVALLAAACGSTASEQSERLGTAGRTGAADTEVGEESGTPDAGGRTGRRGARGATGSSSGEPGSAEGGSASVPREAFQAAPGVTPEAVKLAFIGLDQEATNQFLGAVGVDFIDQGDPDAQAKAIADWINARGGIAGRKLDPVVFKRDPNSGDPNYGETVCAHLTEDNPVFMATSSSTMDAAECFAKHKTVLAGTFSQTEGQYQRFAPYLWGTGVPSSDAGYSALVDGLAGQNFFGSGAKLGIVATDSPDNRVTYKETVLPRLKRSNAVPDEVAWVTWEDTGELAVQVQAAQLRFASRGINRVFFMAPGGGAPLFFMQSAESQQYRPRYGLSSFDSPGFILQAAAPPTQLRGAVGAGFAMTVDVDEQRGDPFPTGEAETRCYEVLKAQDQTPRSRAAMATAGTFCDAAFLLQIAAGSRGEALNVGRFASAVSALGKKFQSTWVFDGGTSFEPGRHWGNKVYRFLRYREGCRCFEYSSGNREIPF